MKRLFISTLLSIFASEGYTQCSVTLTYTPASCQTCCDGCITVSVISDCPPFTYSWLPTDPNFPSVCSACADTTYIVTILDNCECVASDTISVTQVTNVMNLNESLDVTVYPNPTIDKLTISSSTNNMIRCQIVNVKGKINQTYFLNSKEVHLNTSELVSGMYFLQIELDNGQVFHEMVIKE